MVINGQMEVGRPPGTKAGSDLAAHIGIKLPALSFEPGGYKWMMSVDEIEYTSVSFEAIAKGV